MKAARPGVCAFGMCLALALVAACSHSEATAVGTWSPGAAAAYLDQREDWWTGWQGASRDHGTYCVSCHTVLPYALSRSALREALADETPSVNERRILENVKTRVRLWKEIGPYYNDQEDGEHKTEESRGTEAVIDALILATYDAQEGQLSDDTRTAFDQMWALQQTTGSGKGAWPWLDFGLRPWEAKDSPYYGAALAALAVGTAPQNYRLAPGIQDNLRLLRAYLDDEYATQSLANRTVLLWASAKMPSWLDPRRRESLINEILNEQRADGGWSLSSLNRTWRGSSLRSYARSWIRADRTLVETKSDGYATGLVTYTLQQVGIAPESVQMKRGLDWLVRNQIEQEGSWPAYSLNKRRSPSSDAGRFMSDAATAYAVLALAHAGRH